MKAIILAGGFAKRLWPLTKNKPKPLLILGGRTVLDRLAGKLEALPVNAIYISTNKKFEPQFKSWAEGKKVKVVAEPSRAEEEKLGPMAALKFVIEKEKIDEDLLVLGGDNIFDFSLEEIFIFYREQNAPVVGLYDIKGQEHPKRFGVVRIGKRNNVLSFVEKPSRPESSLVSTAVYFFTKESVRLIPVYLKTHKSDSPGYFLSWLGKRMPLYGFVFRGAWFDIGSPESLRRAQEHYGK